MITQDLLNSAKQGDPEALALLLNQQLEPHGLQANAIYDPQDQKLTICLEVRDPSSSPDPQVWLPWLKRGFLRLGTNGGFGSIQVLARDLKTNHSLWCQDLDLRSFELNQPLAPRPTQPPDLVPPDHTDRFLVCGLGRLGQHCVIALKAFEVSIVAIDEVRPQSWQVDHLVNLLENHQPIMGDCRSESVLMQAGILDCRAILLVTQDDGVNLEAAITAQKLNPKIRLVVRSSKQNLNRLLKRKLQNFVAYDPTELPATAFALAALGEETIGSFWIDQCQLQVVRQPVRPQTLFDRFLASRFHKRSYRLLYHEVAPERQSPKISNYRSAPWSEPFFQWRPDTLIEAGDLVVYVEQVETHSSRSSSSASASQTQSRWSKFWSQLVDGSLLTRFSQADFAEVVANFWDWVQGNQMRRNIAVAATIALVLGINTSSILKAELGVQWEDAIRATLVLLLGGFGDIFGGPELELDVPFWVVILSLMTTIISLLFVLGVVGLIADQVISAQFEFLRERPMLPEEDHIVIFGLGRVGRKVAALLQDRKHPVVALTQTTEHESLAPSIPIITGTFLDGLDQVSLEKAKSVVLVTDDQLLNLELGLMAQDLVHHATEPLHKHRDQPLGVVIRTYDQQFSDNLARLLPEAKSLCAYALSAEAFAGAAFGENILGLFRLQDQTILVTEYHVEANDTLNGKLLAHMAYGYGVVPVFYQKAKEAHTQLHDPRRFLMPSDDERLEVGDRLVVLATISGLRRIERGELAEPKQWQLSVWKPLNSSVLFEASRTIHNVTGCGLQRAKEFLDDLPNQTYFWLYDHQAYHLQQRLSSFKQLPVKLQRVRNL